MKDLFDIEVSQVSADFISLRDKPFNASRKVLVQKMWQTYSPLADPDFPQQFAQNVHSRFWEMYLGVCLLERNIFQIIPKSASFGPDFQIVMDGKIIWIEATAPGIGAGEDAVPSIFNLDVTKQVPVDKIILRFTNALTEKYKKREEYINKGVISPEDAFVIAINGGGIDMTQFVGERLPLIAKAVYGAGDYQMFFNRDTMKPVRDGYQVRHHLSKESGSPVPTNFFLDPDFSGVSGILYSEASLLDIPDVPGCDFLYVDNSISNVHLDIFWFGTGKSCYKHDNGLRIVTHPKCHNIDHKR